MEQGVITMQDIFLFERTGHLAEGRVEGVLPRHRHPPEVRPAAGAGRLHPGAGAVRTPGGGELRPAMAFAVATFVVCVAVILGVYWALIVRPEGRSSPRGHQPPRRVRSAGRRAASAGVATGSGSGSARCRCSKRCSSAHAGLHRRHRAAHPRSRTDDVRRRCSWHQLLACCRRRWLGDRHRRAGCLLAPAIMFASIGGLMPYLVVRHKRSQAPADLSRSSSPKPST